MTLNRVCPACHGYGFTTYGSATECPTCAGYGYMPGTVTLSDIAQTPEQRARIRAQARYRKGFALTPRGQEQLHHKQRRQNRQD